jgi:hypothetical protein
VNNELAERALAKQMGWGEADTEKLRRIVGDLQALARLKYDDYGMFKPGVKFLESLVGWLEQFEPAERHDALDFVLRALIFVSFAEIDHLVSCVYPDFIRQSLLDRVARITGRARYRLTELTLDPIFRDLQRRTLVLGLSDGARLDQLRRSSPAFSTEQFHPTYWVEDRAMKDRRDALAEALEQYGTDAPNTFVQVVLVDDFSGSGYSMLRADGDSYKGKLWKIRKNLLEAQQDAFADDVEVLIVLYIATAQARAYLRQIMSDAGLDAWELRVVMELPDNIRVDIGWPTMTTLCNSYYDPLLDDKHKGSVPLGFEQCALPLVLHHNTPNNSVSLLWGDTVGRDRALPLRALFPRYERHHEDRP